MNLKNELEKIVMRLLGVLQFAIIPFLFILLGCAPANALTIYVSASGNDSYDGRTLKLARKSGPVYSLERARDIVRSIRKNYPKQTKPIEVVIAPGIYRRVSAFKLDSSDSGTPQSPTIYRALKAGKTIISGAIPLEVARWRKCEQCKGSTLFYQLGPKLMSASGSFYEDGFGNVTSVGNAELYYKSKKMLLARWPKRGFAKVSTVITPTRFRLMAEGELPKGIESDKSLWVRGYWTQGWADYAKKISIISTVQPLVALSNEKMPYPVALNDRFFFFNGLSLIEGPDDWSFDEINHRVYFWPAETLSTAPEWAVTPSLITAEKVSYIQFHGLNFRQTRGDMLNLKDVHNILIRGCTISGANGWGIVFSGKDSNISDNTIMETGLGGIKAVGGHRSTLEKSKLIISNNVVRDFAQRIRTYQPGISLFGVGMLVSGNDISMAPHAGIIVHGNNHVIEKNTIHHVMSEASDGGAIYMGRDWTERGVRILQNYLYDINSTDGRIVMGVYLDDQASGAEVDGNIFWKVDRAVFIGGGSDNKILNNIYVRSNPAIFLDDRGKNKQKSMTMDPKAELQTRLHKMPYKSSSVWRSNYPELQSIVEDGLGVPKRNQFKSNVFIKSIPYELRIEDSVKLFQDIDKPEIVDFVGRKLPENAPTLVELCQFFSFSVTPPKACSDG